MTVSQSDGTPRKTSNIPGLLTAFSASVTTGGTIYAFGIYGDALKKELSLTQLQLNSISATFFIAGLFTWIPGMVVDRMGMRFSLLLGGCSGACTTLLYWAVARQLIVLQQVVAVLSLLAIAICLSCGLIIGSIFKLTLYCGGESKGVAVGIAKGLVGLGAGVYATIFQALRTTKESALDFIPVLAVFFLVCAVLPAWILLPPMELMNPHRIQFQTTKLHFRTLYLSLLLLAILIVYSSIQDILDSDNYTNANQDTRDWQKVLLILVIWLGPIWALLLLPRKPEDNEEVEPDHDTENTPLANSSSKTTTVDNPVPIAKSETQQDEPVHDLNLSQMLQTPSAWLMLWICIILVGSGTYKTNNMGEMVEALGFADAVTPAAIAIFAVSQAAARIITGISSEAALKWKIRNLFIAQGVPRPFFLVIASTIAFFSHILLAYTTTQTAFVAATTLSGLSFGMAWPLMVLIVGDIFGLKHHGANYMFYDGSTKALGTILLSQYIAASVYQRHVDPQVDAIACFGQYCFMETHLTVAGLAFTGIVASLVLCHTSRDTYQNLIR